MDKMEPMQQENSGDLSLSSIEQIANQMPGGYFIYRADRDGEILYANNIMLDIFGCDTQEEFQALTGGTFRGLVYPDDREAVEASIAAQVSESVRNLDYVEYRIVRRDGAVRWVDDYGRLIHTRDEGDVYNVLLRDITETHEARQESIRKTEVIEGLSIDYTSIYLLSLDSGAMLPYRQQNTYFRTIAAELAAAGTEQDWRHILPVYAERYVLPEDRESFLREVSEARVRERLLTEQSYTVEYRCRDGESDVLYMQMSVVLIGAGTGRMHAVMGFRDNSAQIRRVQREMAERVSMELALEREKSANEVKSAFLFNLSHDIRTPMNAIMGFTGLARRHIRDLERSEGYLKQVDESSRYLLSLIDDLLEMSQIDYGHREIHPAACSLREELDLVVNLFRAQAEEKHLTLTEQADLPEEDVLADAGLFRRVMGNLISNAVKFTPENGSVTVTARQRQVSESGYARYEFTVADTGIGMTKEFMERMYQEFERAETSTRSGSTGTGLGLSIAKRLLDRMGGSLSAVSEKGVGTTFTVSLPLKLADGAAEDGDLSAAGEGEALQGGGEFDRKKGERRILLVEDIEINRLLAETILEEAGFLVESVPDGCDAVDAVRKHPPRYYDLILMDIQMPVMNGYEAARAIRALEREDAKKIPIVALSANAREEDKRMSIESGMNHHVAKPFDVEQLIATVNKFTAE